MMQSNRTLSLALAVLVAAAFVAAPAQAAKPAKKGEGRPGYTDTPKLPDQEWTVHDSRRPYPPVVEVGSSPTLGLKAPAGATVLFDGKNLDQWTAGKNKRNPKGGANWKVENGYAEVNGTGSIRTKENLGSMYLHIEFATPKQVKGSSQGRGNSGVIIMGKYEIQVLDSYKNATYPDGQCASIYGQFPPLWNASRAPGEWQTYDIYFQAPKWDKDGKLVSPAISTVYHNGVLVQDKQAHIGQVSHRRVGRYFQPHGDGPLNLQDHGNPIRYRNIWYTAIPKDKLVDPKDANTTVPESRRDGKPVKMAGGADAGTTAKITFTPGSCCDKAAKKGGACTHGCCVKAVQAGHACKKCNKG